jgi:Alpha-glucosidases, family 31 of glycosyl hydrolases
LVTENDELYLARGWPGLSALPDFLNPRCRELWASHVAEFVSTYKVDGVWLDMNEPTVFNCDVLTSRSRMYALAGATPHPLNREELYCKAPRGAYHVADGVKIPHEKVRGLYPYYEAEATYKGLQAVGKEPFILSRSGYLAYRSTPPFGQATCPAPGRG